MNYKVFYVSRVFKRVKFCGGFLTLYSAINYVDHLQDCMPNGKKIAFKIEGRA